MKILEFGAYLAATVLLLWALASRLLGLNPLALLSAPGWLIQGCC